MLAVGDSSREEPHFVVGLCSAEVAIQMRGIQLQNLIVISVGESGPVSRLIRVV